MQIYEFHSRGKRKPPIWWDRGLRLDRKNDSGLDLVQPQEFCDSLDVEGDDGFLTFFGFQEGKVIDIVVEKILREDGCCIGIPEQVKVLLKVRISVGIVGADALTGKIFHGSFVETVGQLVGKRVALAGVGAPSAGFHPLGAVAGCVCVDADDGHVLDRKTDLAGHVVGAGCSVRQREVGFLRIENLDIVAAKTKVLRHSVPDDTVELVLPESSVRRAFAGGVDPVPGIENNFVHGAKKVEFE